MLKVWLFLIVFTNNSYKIYNINNSEFNNRYNKLLILIILNNIYMELNC